MMKGLLYVLLGVFLSQSLVWAVPMPTKARKLGDNQLIVYPDTENPDLYWFVPLIKPMVKNGKLVYTKRTGADGKISFVFAVVPYMPKDQLRLIAESIPKIHSLEQLQPVIAKRMGIKIDDPVQVSAMIDKATDIKYLDYSQKFRLNLTASEAEALEDDLKSGFGLRANLVMSFDSERVTKSLNIDLKYEDVYKALGIGAGAGMLFTRAQIQAGLSNYLGKKYMNVTGKGNLDIPPVVQQVILTFFKPYNRAQTCSNNGGYNGGWGGNNGGWNPSYPNGGLGGNWLKMSGYVSDARNEISDNHLISSLSSSPKLSPSPTPSSTPSPTPNPSASPTPWPTGTDPGGDWPDNYPTSLPTSTPFPGSTGYPDPSGGYWPSGSNGNGIGNGNGACPGGNMPINPMGISALFEFNAQKANNNDSFVYHSIQTADTEEVVVLPVDLTTDQPEVGASKAPAFTKIADKNLEIGSTSTSTSPTKSGVSLDANDKLFIDTAFTLSFQNNQGQVEYVNWDSSWPSPDEDLYYRIGNGPWIKMSKRVVIEPSSPFLGEIQFYMDRSAIFNKIPEDLRKQKFIFPAKFTFERTLPIYHVTISGEHFSNPAALMNIKQLN